MPSPLAPLTVADVVVLGAGPAGSAAARLLAARGHSVVILARTPTGRSFAESLPPSSTRLFDALGVRAAIDGAQFIRATGNTVHWAARDIYVEAFDGPTLGYQVSRDTFDTLLLDDARAAGAVLHANSIARRAEPDSDVLSVTYDAPAGRQTIRAPWVLDCSGRSGVVARRGWRKAEPRARTTAIVGVWRRTDEWPVDDNTHTFVESYPGGWAWSVPTSHGERFVTVMLDPSVTDVPGRPALGNAYRAEIARTAMVRRLVAGATLDGAPWGRDATPYSADRVSGDGMLLIGDAASFVDPLSSFGVKKALASAWLAAVAVDTAIAEPAMAAAAFDLFDRRERAMFDNLQRQSAALSRDAAGAYDSAFWRGRVDGTWDDSPDEIDVSVLRADARVVSAFEELKRRPVLKLRAAGSMRVVDRPIVRGHRIVLEQHLSGPALPGAIRYCRNVNLVLIATLAAQFDQVPDLFDAYNRAAPPAPLPDFLGALSTLVGLELLTFA
jgi:flavin-dependent dehydrogenase